MFDKPTLFRPAGTAPAELTSGGGGLLCPVLLFRRLGHRPGVQYVHQSAVVHPPDTGGRLFGQSSRRITHHPLIRFKGPLGPLKTFLQSLRPLPLLPGDVILLCSDGISGILSPAELLEAMSLEPDAGCALLETMVREKDLPEQDNYTGILIACT